MRKSVREALADAEAKTGVTIQSVVLAVTGSKVAAYDGGPTWEEIFEWEEICYADQGEGVLRRVSLGVCKRVPGFQVVWGAGTRIENTIRCLKDLGVEVEKIVFAPVASAAAVLGAKQKQLGALVIDIGFGTTDYAVYSDGVLVQSDSFPIGGEDIADDFLLALSLPDAWKSEIPKIEESLRRRCAIPDERLESKEPELLNAVVRHRMHQALYRVKCRLINTGVRLDSLRAGVHLTGGCALQAGICDIAEKVFGLPAPRARVKGKFAPPDMRVDPRFACAGGLAHIHNHDRARIGPSNTLDTLGIDTPPQ